MSTDLLVAVCLIVIIGIAIHSRYKKIPTTDEKLSKIKEQLIAVEPQVANLNFYVNHEDAFTMDKRDIYMCMKDKNGVYYPDNFLMYVALHEVAHAIIPTDTSTHPPIFNEVFTKLKDKAEKIGLYNPSIPFPDTYCNKNLKYH